MPTAQVHEQTPIMMTMSPHVAIAERLGDVLRAHHRLPRRVSGRRRGVSIAFTVLRHAGRITQRVNAGKAWHGEAFVDDDPTMPVDRDP
jgi:hypothetical protein